MSPTARSLEWLRERGWSARVVERRNPFTHKLSDVFGADIVAIHRAQKITLWVQATSGANHGARVKKCLGNPEVADVLAVGHHFEVWSWAKKKAGWQLQREALTLMDFSKENAFIEEENEVKYARLAGS